ncbi:MAG: helix-turn-helix transcriptional regulator [Pseudonocardiales bacterium]|nr:helix-turn-helix transcriptional regulator [Pseudonocardiales bacterium]
MDADKDVHTIGRRVRQIRRARGKSLRVVAGLAGMSKSELSRIERGETALDRHSEIVALAEVLQVAPSELIRVEVPAPGNGDADTAIEAVRRALMAINHRLPGGQVLPVEALRAKVATVMDEHWRCDKPGDVGAALATLMRDLHSSIAAGKDVAELLDLTILLHTQVTVGWLRVAGASWDLRWQAAALAHDAAQRLDTPTALGIALWGGFYVTYASGASDLALAALDAVTVPTNTPESMQLAGTLALCRSLLAVVDSRPQNVEAPFQQAVELAERTGEGNAYGMAFGPTTVGLWRMFSLLEAHDYEQAVRIGDGLHPEVYLPRLVQADYWADYGRALARVRGRRDDAIAAFQRSEEISPHRLCRDPLTKDVIAELLVRSRRDSVSRELRRMAYRAGLPV